MRQAMVTAELGNDVFREDPTILSLETKMSTILGKEKGLFVASGTMGNLLSIMVHCPGSDFDIIVGDKSHINKYEHAGATCVAGVLVKTVPNQSDGTINLEDIKVALNSGTEEHKTKTKMIGLENTHNMCGGVVLNPEYCRAVRQLIENQDIALHLDGARIFNAAVALSVPPSELAAPFDSVSVCLSKDLGAPVGSVLCGSSQFIEQARRLRKMLGGGWAQAGVLAACGLVALDGYETRIALDHNNATVFANKIKQIPGLSVDMSTVQTNITFFSVVNDKITAQQLVQKLSAKESGKSSVNVGVVAFGPTMIRAVFHPQISTQQVEMAAEKIAGIMSEF